MTGIERNQDLQTLADMIRADDSLGEKLRSGSTQDLDTDFSNRLEAFLNQYGDLTFTAVLFFKDRHRLIRLMLEMVKQAESQTRAERMSIMLLTADFISCFPKERRGFT